MNRIVFTVGTVLIALSPYLVEAQLLDPVSYNIVESPDTVKSGKVFNVVVEAEIEGEWHLYSALNDPHAGPYPTTFSSASDKMVVAGQVNESEARIVLDPNFNTELGWHSKRALFTIPLAFRENLQGRETIELDVLYQVCDDISCLPPKTKNISASIVLAGVSDTPFTEFEDEQIDFIINLPYAVQAIIVIGLVGVILFFGYLFQRVRES